MYITIYCARTSFPAVLPAKLALRRDQHPSAQTILNGKAWAAFFNVQYNRYQYDINRWCIYVLYREGSMFFLLLGRKL